MAKTESGLPPQREKFAQYVAAGKKQAEAFRLAYPNSKKWKDSAVWENASSMAADPKVSARIEELRKKHAEKVDISAERTLLEIRRIAFFDIRKVFNSDGTLKKVYELDDDTAAAIAEIDMIEIEGDGQLVIGKFKTVNKNDALEKLCKHLGLFAKNNVREITGAGGGPLAVANVSASDLTDDQLAAILAGEDAAE